MFDVLDIFSLEQVAVKAKRLRSCTEATCMSIIPRPKFRRLVNILDSGIGNQASNANEALNAFISSAGHRPGFAQEIRESCARLENGNLWINHWILVDG